MPTAEKDRLVPRSVFRYRPIAPETDVHTIPAWRTRKTSCTKPLRRQVHPPIAQPTATRKVLPPAAQLSSPVTLHWTVPVGLTMTGMVLLALIVQLVGSWSTNLYEALHYGMPRTMQVDAFVGHESGGKVPSHFLAENLRGQVLIIEFPGGDFRHARVFAGPQITGANADEVPVTISFQPRDGDRLPDMLVQFGNMAIWYKNEHGTFVPQ